MVEIPDNEYKKMQNRLKEFERKKVEWAEKEKEKEKETTLLRESEARYRMIFDSAADGLVKIDSKGTIIDVNQQMEKLTDLPVKEYIGKNFATLRHIIPGESIPIILKHFGERILGKEIAPYVIKIRRADGTLVDVEINAKPIREDEKITGEIVVIRDVSVRKRAEENLRESEEKYRMQFEASLDAIFLAEAETGIIIDCNRAAQELVGRDRSELIGKHQKILHPPEEIGGEFSRTFKLHLKEKAGQVLETKVVAQNGALKDVAIKASPFELRGKKVIQGVFRDISESKRAEEELKKRAGELEKMNKFMIGRELDMIELKKKINCLCKELKQPAKYPEVEE